MLGRLIGATPPIWRAMIDVAVAPINRPNIVSPFHSVGAALRHRSDPP
jgi:hypothetical protein